ncbi:MAG TPA: enoyl-CoA hydratase [Casimicrobiaceae bacterium]|nr:enoyl-CoA hydratase [Casimicrobiaceae bacterium]
MNKRADASEVASDDVVLTSIASGVARLTLNRPRQFNAISMEVLDALHSALARIASDESVRVVVLAGNGQVFSAGHDLKQMMANRNEAFIGALFKRCSEVMLAMQALPQPVIARVHGVATAAGCQIVAACDLAIASSEARFATSGINFGLFCATPGVPVSRNVSRKRAFEMLFTGEFIDAATAKDWGLVNSVVPPDELDAAVERYAAVIVGKPRAVVAAGKALFYEQLEARLRDAYDLASCSITRNMLGDDAAEGVGAFIDKRKPNWS